ncbi:phosphotransferase family protein [Streptomyces turgidiscabies]|uniref:Phosphotransferase enzyme family protein n=1 Tax=Streptomyces turgidiscabies (strain Car8) TaxID=698760 RepID=L7EVY6_STRT8|nr:MULTISPECIES: phosphotransferase family protein [Streptomyces]ELP63573.1 phosphotransferase enzyme family protein [Streptomyces turgidiscabies Car8]MDX3496247.1 phosphotransferase family protein [Streptomyces turgidiscabies]GAQ75257.1 putative aminoglycoside phosphotransferase [Streptomyces turgidiscabies]
MSTTTEVTELAARVRAHLADRHPGGPFGDLRTLPGGHSGLTYAITAGTTSYVVKAVPPGQRPVGRNDVLRQARILRVLAGSPVPVPGVAAVDEREPAWFAMEFVAGEAVEPVLDEHRTPSRLCRTRMLALAGVLRDLHGMEAEAAEAQASEPPLDPDGELARWARTMEAVPIELRPGAEELIDLLATRIPTAIPPVLTHGDFRLGNVLCRGERPAAVIDWEIWAHGDPRVDLAWFLLFADHRNFPRLGRPVPGLPGEGELLAAYLDGRPEPPDLDWFRALARTKMAAIMGHNLRRHREGKHHDPDQERLPPTIAAMIRTACDIVTTRP